MTTIRDDQKNEYVRPAGEIQWSELEPSSLTSTRKSIYTALVGAGFTVAVYGCVGFDEPRWRKLDGAEETVYTSVRKSAARIVAKRSATSGLVAVDAFWWSPQQVGDVYALMTFVGWPTRVGNVTDLRAAIKAAGVVRSGT